MANDSDIQMTKVGEKLWQAEPTPEHIKQMIAADLVAGEKPMDLVAKYNVSAATVSRIKKKYINPAILQKMEEDKAAVLGDLMILGLEANIQACVRIASVTENPGWLASQNAGDLGKLYGIMHDKQIRTIEAMEFLANAGADVSEGQDLGAAD